MTRLMSTAATVIALSTAAYAQDAQTFVEYQAQPEQDLFASDLMGSRIYAIEGEVSGPVESSATAEWSDLGEVNDMILSEDGSVEVVVLGIGGFLGIGERDAAIPMDQLQIVRNASDMADYFLVVDATREEIETAPEFVRNQNSAEGMEGAGTGTGMETGGGMDGDAGQTMENTGGSMNNAAEEAAQEAGQAAEEAGQAAEEAGQAAEDATPN